jgi:uncharacterized protein (DUF433 family)
LPPGRIEELLSDFLYIEELDIREALAFAARLAQVDRSGHPRARLLRLK